MKLFFGRILWTLWKLYTAICGNYTPQFHIHCVFDVSYQVTLVNAPEIMSKYLGESEKNLR